LWNEGLMTYDVSMRQNFLMKVALLWTVSDFPAYGMLYGRMTSGKLACPYCMEHTKSFRLANAKKQSWFDCHRQFLPMDHRFRRNKSVFYKNREEHTQTSCLLIKYTYNKQVHICGTTSFTENQNQYERTLN